MVQNHKLIVSVLALVYFGLFLGGVISMVKIPLAMIIVFSVMIIAFSVGIYFMDSKD